MAIVGELNRNLIGIGLVSFGGFLFGGSSACWILERTG